MRCALLIGWVLGLWVGVAPPATGSTSYQTRAGGRVAWGYDNNILEKVRSDRHVGESFLRLEADATLTALGTVADYWPAQWRVRYSTDRYWRTPRESRHILHGAARWRTGSRAIPIWSAWETTWRTHRQDDTRGYLRHQAAVGGEARPGGVTRYSWEGRLFMVQTPAGGTTAREGFTLQSGVDGSLGPALRGGLELGGGRMSFDEHALAAPEENASGLLAEKHRSTEFWAGLTLEHLGLPRATLAYRFRSVHSNSFGYDHRRHEVELNWGSRLPGRWLLVLVGRFEAPMYVRDEYRIYRLREDSDDPDLGARSGAVLQLSRPVAGGWSPELRVAYERNESRVSGRYYEKLSLSIGMRLQVSTSR